MINTVLIAGLLLAGCTSTEEGSKEDSFIPEETVQEHAEGTNEPMEDTKEILVTIGSQAFTAVLADTSAAKEFYESLPITFTMNELNGNEFYAETENAFTSDPVVPQMINTGDIKLFNDDCIVLFYDTFETEYSYTDIAYITDTTGLSEALLNNEAGTVSFDQN